MKYYWLRLQKDFFKRHDIRIIEELENGKDYILFYLKLLVESVSHEGELRFSETIPYDEKMLATVTNTNIDIVRSAMKVFTELGMIEVLEDKTIYMTEVSKMIGSTSEEDPAKRENNRLRQQRHREKLKALHNGDVTVIRNGEIEIETDIETDKEKESKPIKHRHGEFEHVLLTDQELEKLNSEYGQDQTEQAIKYLDEYIEMKGAKYKSHYLALRKWVFDAVKEKKERGKGSKPKKSFANFEQRQYDMDSFEAMLLKTNGQNHGTQDTKSED